jgi:hypothetical protein
MQTSTHLSNVQQELLKIYSTNLPDNELLKLKRVMADFFKKELLNETAQFAKDKNLTEKDFERMLNEK